MSSNLKIADDHGPTWAVDPAHKLSFFHDDLGILEDSCRCYSTDRHRSWIRETPDGIPSTGRPILTGFFTQ